MRPLHHALALSLLAPLLYACSVQDAALAKHAKEVTTSWDVMDICKKGPPTPAVTEVSSKKVFDMYLQGEAFVVDFSSNSQQEWVTSTSNAHGNYWILCRASAST